MQAHSMPAVVLSRPLVTAIPCPFSFCSLMMSFPDWFVLFFHLFITNGLIGVAFFRYFEMPGKAT